MIDVSPSNLTKKQYLEHSNAGNTNDQVTEREQEHWVKGRVFARYRNTLFWPLISLVPSKWTKICMLKRPPMPF